jgi:hypothetical protein
VREYDVGWVTSRIPKKSLDLPIDESTAYEKLDGME